jgi:hypothetical protein
MGRGLVTTAAKLSTLWGCVAEGEAQLTLDVLVKGPVRSPLLTSSRSFGLLPMTLLPVSGSRGMRTMKIILVLVVVPVAVRDLIVVRTTSVTAKIRVMMCWAR